VLKGQTVRAASLRPARVEERFNRLTRRDPMPVADADRIPAGKGGVYRFFRTGSVNELSGTSFDAKRRFGKRVVVGHVLTEFFEPGQRRTRRAK